MILSGVLEFEVLENFSHRCHGSSFGSRGHKLQCSTARACRLGDFSGVHVLALKIEISGQCQTKSLAKRLVPLMHQVTLSFCHSGLDLQQLCLKTLPGLVEDDQPQLRMYLKHIVSAVATVCLGPHSISFNSDCDRMFSSLFGVLESSYSECTCHLRQGAIALCRFAIGDFWGALTDALVCFFGFLCIFAPRPSQQTFWPRE